MDYSLLVGIHDCAQAEEEAILNENLNREAAAGRETSESEECESGERYERCYKCIWKMEEILYSILIYLS